MPKIDLSKAPVLTGSRYPDSLDRPCIEHSTLRYRGTVGCEHKDGTPYPKRDD